MTYYVADTLQEWQVSVNSAENNFNDTEHCLPYCVDVGKLVVKLNKLKTVALDMAFGSPTRCSVLFRS
jgi:hypothetical protein